MNTQEINNLLNITESYKAPAAMMQILFDKEKREALFRNFLEIETDISCDWFQSYFEDEHSDRKVKKQDFTPDAVSNLLSKIVIVGESHSNLDVAAGTGGITIKNGIRI